MQIEATFIQEFLKLNKFFNENNIPYAIIGGIATSFWGEPRYTRDVDFTIVTDKNTEELVLLLKEKGFDATYQVIPQIRIKKDDFIADILYSKNHFEEQLVMQAEECEMYDNKVRMGRAEDIILMKLQVTRHRDLLDIENILSHKNDLDWGYLKGNLFSMNLMAQFEEEFGSLQEWIIKHEHLRKQAGEI